MKKSDSFMHVSKYEASIDACCLHSIDNVAASGHDESRKKDYDKKYLDLINIRDEMNDGDFNGDQFGCSSHSDLLTRDECLKPTELYDDTQCGILTRTQTINSLVTLENINVYSEKFKSSYSHCNDINCHSSKNTTTHLCTGNEEMLHTEITDDMKTDISVGKIIGSQNVTSMTDITTDNDFNKVVISHVSSFHIYPT